MVCFSSLFYFFPFYFFFFFKVKFTFQNQVQEISSKICQLKFSFYTPRSDQMSWYFFCGEDYDRCTYHLMHTKVHTQIYEPIKHCINIPQWWRCRPFFEISAGLTQFIKGAPVTMVTTTRTTILLNDRGMLDIMSELQTISQLWELWEFCSCKNYPGWVL